MKFQHSIFLFFLLLVFSCYSVTKEEHSIPISKEIHSPLLQSLLDSALLEGSILIYDKEKDIFYSNDFERANTAYLPASTFKIPNSIIALETGLVENEHTIFKWDGTDRFLDIWEKDMNFKEAYQQSCVPCYQEIARNIGEDRMSKYLKLLDFGQMQMDSSNLDEFWLRGESKISSFEQIEFLMKLNQSQLAISKKTEDIMETVMLLEQNNDYQLRGKTGWSTANQVNLGWFVAILDSKGKTYYLATNIKAKDSFDMTQFSRIRKSISMEALKQLHFVKNDVF